MDVLFVCVQYTILITVASSSNDCPTGPYTEIVGGVRPFKEGENVTHSCTVIGGGNNVTLTWFCLIPYMNKTVPYSDNKVVKQVTLLLTSSNNYYNCACHATHRLWNDTKVVPSKPVLFQTKPIIGGHRELYTAISDKPVTIKIDYYAYPTNTSVTITKTNGAPMESEDVTEVYQESNVQFIVDGYTYQAVGETFYWRVARFNESDYGNYTAILQNDINQTMVQFVISRADSHSLVYVYYGAGALCVLCLVGCFVAATVTRCRRPELKPEVPRRNLPPRTTLNTDRGVYTDRAVFRRSRGLPDTNTVDRVINQRTKPKRPPVKVPPILAVFRRSRGLPDTNVLAEVHDAVSRSNSNIPNGHHAGSPNTRDDAHQNTRQHAATMARELNYPHIEIRNIDTRSPATIPRSRPRTNYSEIDFYVNVPTVNEETCIDEDNNNYGSIFFEQPTTLPPRAANW